MLPSALTACTLYRLPFRPHDASVFQTLACEILPFCELVPLCQSPLCSLFTRSLVDALLVPYRSLHVSLGYSYEYVVHYTPFALGAPKAAPARPGLRPYALSMRETMCTDHESIWFLLLAVFPWKIHYAKRRLAVTSNLRYIKIHYAKRRFSVTSNLRYMHRVLNVDEIKN
jgi:hypothetical protein